MPVNIAIHRPKFFESLQFISRFYIANIACMPYLVAFIEIFKKQNQLQDIADQILAEVQRLSVEVTQLLKPQAALREPALAARVKSLL